MRQTELAACFRKGGEKGASLGLSRSGCYYSVYPDVFKRQRSFQLGFHNPGMTTDRPRAAALALISLAFSGLVLAQDAPRLERSHYADRVSDVAVPLRAELIFGADLEIRSAAGKQALAFDSICQLSYSKSAAVANGMTQSNVLTIRFRESELGFHNLVLQVPARLSSRYLTELSSRTGLIVGQFRTGSVCSSAPAVFATQK